eukprot:m.52198 g.52198  ORF g.52198 m.52198 type:complete len:524 (+) comp13050_c0_seq1:29-1600(+)
MLLPRLSLVLPLLALVVLLALQPGDALHPAAAERLDPPDAPALARSAWPICHHDIWCSDSTPQPGLASASGARVQLLADLFNVTELADPISLVMEASGKALWGSTVSEILRVGVDTAPSAAKGLHVLARTPHNISFQFHGAYSLLSKANIYYASGADSIEAYAISTAEVDGDGETDGGGGSAETIKHVASYQLPHAQSDEHVVGLSILSDGWLAVSTSRGRVQALAPDLAAGSDILQLPGQDVVALPSHMVSNSFAVDSQDNIYVVTSLHQHSIAYSAADHTLKIRWSTQYSSGQDPWFFGRLGPGSGSTPTVFGPNGEYLVITDGQTPMRLLVFNTSDGSLAAAAPVNFVAEAEGRAGASDGNSTSEQSVVAYGNRVAVVNNWFPATAAALECERAAAHRGNEWLSHICPAVLGEAAYGVAQYELVVSPEGVATLARTWLNTEVSCTSSIPVLSRPDNTLFCLGKSTDGTFTIEALDWLTGAHRFAVPLGRGLQFNSLYAGTEIGSQKDIIMGTMAGILRVH